MIVFITGPVRAGKTAFALELARASGRVPVYVATCELDPDDPEMAARVARHRAERDGMPTRETSERRGPTLAETLLAAPAGELLVVDSLGTWLSGHVLDLAERLEADPVAAAADLEVRAAGLLPVLGRMRADAIFISEETGWGVVPPSPAGRLFRDQLGRTAADIAKRADQAFLVVAGYAVDLARAGRPITG